VGEAIAFRGHASVRLGGSLALRELEAGQSVSRGHGQVHNIACSMKGIPARIIKLQIGNFTKADAEWGRRVAEALGVTEPVAVK
jgi:hypothetical protein